MKKYVGTKHLEAEPMTMGEAYRRNLLQAGRIPNEEQKDAEGYYVRYADGYESWSPKEAFEAAYQCEETFVDRLEVERQELMQKLVKCATFVDGSDFRKVIKDDYPAFFLTLQRSLMGRYLQVLESRLHLAKGELGTPHLARMSFGVALEALKFGFGIRRSGWNGKGLAVFKQIPAHIEDDIIPNMQSLPKKAKELIISTKGYIDYTSQCIIYNENTGRADSWVPSVSDIFADDWEIII